MRFLFLHIFDFLDFKSCFIWKNWNKLSLLTFLGPAATYRTVFCSCGILVFAYFRFFGFQKLLFMEKLQTTHFFDVFGTSDLTQIDFLWPRGPQGSREGPQGSREGPQGGPRGAQSAMSKLLWEISTPHWGAMMHDTGGRVVHHGVSQATL